MAGDDQDPFDDGYVREFVEVQGVGPVLTVVPRRPPTSDPLGPAEVSQSKLARRLEEVALGDLLDRG